MPTRYSKLLGLAIGEGRALVAEVSANGGGSNRAVAERVGEFVYPDRVTLAEPDALGRALGEFLLQKGFSTRNVVIGMPGKWVLSKRIDAPAADPDLVADSLRLQAEAEFSADGSGFVCDYAGETSASETKSVLLMAAPQRQLDQVNALVAAARMKAIAVVPFAATLSAIAGRNGGGAKKDTRMLLLGPGGAEFIASRGGQPRSVRYLGPTSSSAKLLAGELRRASVAAGFGGSAANGLALGVTSSNGAAAGGDLLVWNDAGLESQTIELLRESLGASTRIGEMSALGASYQGNGSAADATRFAAPISLAIAGLEASRGARDDRRNSLPVDFLHSRLAAPPAVRIQRRTLILACTGLAILLLAGGALWDLHSQQSEVDALQAQIKSDEEHVKTAQATVAKVSYVKPWSDTDPLFVSCLNELTKSIPEEGQVFLTSLSFADSRKGTLAGKANNPTAVLALLDRLQASGRFADIHSLYETPRKATPKAAPPPQPAPPAPAPMPTPQMPQPAPGVNLPPGVVLPPGAMLPPGAAAPQSVQVVSGTLAMVNGEPQANPAAITVAQAAPTPAGPSNAAAMAAAMQEAMKNQGGARPPSARGGKKGGAPSGDNAPATAGAGPSSSGSTGSGGGGAGNEVTFTMTFTYVPG